MSMPPQYQPPHNPQQPHLYHPQQQPQQPPKRKPWLPLKHIIGLSVVAAFTLAGVTGTVGWNNLRGEQLQLESAELSERYDVNIFTDLSNALRGDDRAAFVAWGEGEGAEQLGRIWDETKKIGWTTGYVEGNTIRTDPEDDSKRLDEPHLTIGFDLGFTNERMPNPEDGDTGGILVHSFEYDVDIVGDDPVDQRITAMRPKAPMPWDDPAGVAVAKADNVVLFGFAEEQATLDANIADAQFGAEGVLSTGYAEEGYLELRGFTGMISTDRDKYLSSVYGVGFDEAELERQWREAGLAKTSPTPWLYGQEAPDLYTGLSDSSGVLVFFDGTGIGDGMARTSTHEFAHALHRGVSGISMSFLDSDTSAQRAVTEGFARFVEDKVMSPLDGDVQSMRPDVFQAVAAAATVDDLVSAAAFDGSATSHMAYNASANYFQFTTAMGESPVVILRDSETQSFPFELWTVYRKSPAGDSLSADAWQQWAAAQ